MNIITIIVEEEMISWKFIFDCTNVSVLMIMHNLLFSKTLQYYNKTLMDLKNSTKCVTIRPPTYLTVDVL